MTNANAPLSYSTHNEFDLAELAGILWRGKWLISACALSVAIIAVVATLFLPNIYQARALLAPNQQEGASGLSALASQYGGLAGLAGIDLGADSSDKSVLGLEILKSRKFLADFVDRRDILVPLMAARSWNPSSGALEIDAADYDAANKRWVRSVSAPRQPQPSAQEAYEEFRKILSVTEDGQTGFITVAVEHRSPTIARDWVTWLVEDLNATVMERDVSEAQQAIKYLRAQIANTQLASLQNVFYGLIEEQLKTVMLAEVTDEYLFKTIDPAVAPEKKARPRRALIVAIAGLAGLLIGAALQLARSRPAATR